ncbi:MAG: hypothetical protein PUC74_02365 [Succinatimonas sp.]|nr:hypothetical protein [Succinatimonas sp.]
MTKNYLEPKNGDFASLIDELGVKDYTKFKADVVNTNYEHLRHSVAPVDTQVATLDTSAVDLDEKDLNTQQSTTNEKIKSLLKKDLKHKYTKVQEAQVEDSVKVQSQATYKTVQTGPRATVQVRTDKKKNGNSLAAIFIPIVFVVIFLLGATENDFPIEVIAPVGFFLIFFFAILSSIFKRKK